MKLWHLAAAAWLVGYAGAAHAQQATPAQPVDVEADQMEVRDAENIAIFTGSVVAIRGTTKMIADRMVAHYANPATGKAQNGQAPAGAFSGSEVTRIESQGNVRIDVPGQIVTGSAADLDVPNDILIVTGQVTVTAGQSVVKGTRLVSDLRKKTSQMSGGRVSGSFVPGAK